MTPTSSLARLEGRLAQVPGRDRADGDRLLNLLRSQRATARQDLLVVLRSDRYAELLERLVDAARSPRLLPRVGGETDEELLRDAVRRPWNHLRDAIEALPDDPADEELHEVRKRAKRVRLRDRGRRARVREARPGLRPRR